MNKVLFYFFTLCIGSTFLSCYSQLPLKKFKLSDELNEVSGLYIQTPNTFWWHNDGGNPSQIYRTNGVGNTTKTVPLSSLQNKDWEDLSHDDKGNIYIGDFGNNLNRRQDLRIYIYEPKTQKIDSILFQYADQTAFPPNAKQANFDMEAFFWYKDSLHLFSKNNLQSGDYFTKHYSLSQTSSKLETAILKNKIYLKNRVVTGAAISPDGCTIALMTYNYKKIFNLIPYSIASIFLIKNFNGTDFLKGEIYKKRMPYAILSKQFEAIDFLDNQTLYVASEKTLFFVPKAKRIKLKPRDFGKRKRIK